MPNNELLANLFRGAGIPDFLTTAELAALERVAPQTIRKNYCLKGHHHGLVPIKLPNGGLRWRTSHALTLMKTRAK